MQMRKIQLLLLIILFNSLNIFGQTVNITGLSTTGRFNNCLNNNGNPYPAPTVTATLMPSSTGTSIVGGNLVCNDNCGTTTLRIDMNGMRWNQTPNSEWLHGIFLPANAGFTIAPVIIPPGFITYAGCVGTCPSGSGTNGGPGFYFDNTGVIHVVPGRLQVMVILVIILEILL
jgi:hypothetical protein